MVDDFFKSIENTAIGKKLQEHWQSSRVPQKRLSLSEIVTLNMIRFYVRLIDLKSFHRLTRNEYGRYFPQLPNTYLQLNRMNSTEDTYFIDATALSVCHNVHISSHKVAKGFAQRGKTTKGWFDGFKLHGVCDGRGKLMSKEKLRLLRKRSIIETQWGVLKERFALVYHLSRSMTGLCRHYLYSIASFIFQSFFPKGCLPKIPA